MKRKQKKPLKAKKKKVKLKKDNKKVKNNSFRKVLGKIIKMENIYSIINNAQLGKKQIIFSSDFENSYVIENMLRDSEINYSKKELKTKVVYTLSPSGKEEKEDGLLERIELFEDEFPEDDLLF